MSDYTFCFKKGGRLYYRSTCAEKAGMEWDLSFPDRLLLTYMANGLPSPPAEVEKHPTLQAAREWVTLATETRP